MLAYLIYNTFSDIDKNIWSITEYCFRIKNSIPNTKTMKKDMSEINQGYSNKPKGYKDIDNILLQK
ncbi:hypothetical protein D0T57_14460 [Dysgonomonas sp. 511]|nr:hypothetical protein [Dysgonomonas sp. 511]